MESLSHTHAARPSRDRPSIASRWRELPLPRPELAALVVLAAVLDLWALSKNGWANDYYSAAVRSMSGSWHDFLYGSFDSSGLMTVDKPPLALWVQALSVKAFGFNSLAILVPQALMGVTSVALVYDLTRRRWGRAAGAIAGSALALTPVFVAISRHNNPDALLVLCCVAALWCFVRALEDGRTKWLVLAGVAVGLGFEAKMGAALLVVPGMAVAWLWVAPRGRVAALRQLALAGAALVAVALAWPVLVWLTPAGSRPWVSGTSDNSIWSLIWEYNGFGRLEGQTGGPSSFGGGGPFGGESGLFRLLNASLGGQAGWTLGLSLVGGIGIAALSRLRRTDPRTGWILAVAGAFAVTAVAFSFAGGIFHPYYVSELAPFAAALVGATFAAARDGGRPGRLLGALAIAAGAVTELVVFGGSAGDVAWLTVPVTLVALAAAAFLLSDRGEPKLALAGAIGVLLIAPAIWSFATLGHPTSGTFPAGGPESASAMSGPGGGPGGFGGPGAGGEEGRGESESETPLSGAPPAGLGEMAPPSGFGPPSAESGEMLPPGATGSPSEGRGEIPGSPSQLPEAFGGSSESTGPEMGAGPSSGSAGGGMFGGANLESVLSYTESHGGGTIAVGSQSEAAGAIIEAGAEVAGIGGFSGKESTVSVAWLEEAIASGRVRWILAGEDGQLGGGPSAIGGPSGGDTREGSEAAISTVTETCEAVPAAEYESSAAGEGGRAGALYDCGA